MKLLLNMFLIVAFYLILTDYLHPQNILQITSDYKTFQSADEDSNTGDSIVIQMLENNQSSGSQSFNVGMFSVVGNNSWSPNPGTQEFRNELQLIWQGTSDEYLAISSIHTYGHYIGDSFSGWNI
jgi:hypothetical protein